MMIETEILINQFEVKDKISSGSLVSKYIFRVLVNYCAFEKVSHVVAQNNNST
jgi:hypothetical protein